MADYNNVAELRAALSSDDPDKRAEAYGDVLNQDVQPTSILKTPPDSAAVQTLEQAGVVAPASGSRGPPQAEQWERVVALLEEIAANTGGGSA